MDAIDDITRILAGSHIDDYANVIAEYKAEELILEAWIASLDGERSPMSIFITYIDSSGFKYDLCPIRRRLWIDNTRASANEIAEVFMGLPDHHKHWVHIYSWTYDRNTADIHTLIKLVENDIVALYAAIRAFVERADKINVNSQDFESMMEYYHRYKYKHKHLKSYLYRQIIWSVSNINQRYWTKMVLDNRDQADVDIGLMNVKHTNYHLYNLLSMYS